MLADVELHQHIGLGIANSRERAVDKTDQTETGGARLCRGAQSRQRIARGGGATRAVRAVLSGGEEHVLTQLSLRHSAISLSLEHGTVVINDVRNSVQRTRGVVL